MTATQIDPDVLWIRFREALREGRLAEAAVAQRALEAAGYAVRVGTLEAQRRTSEVRK